MKKYIKNIGILLILLGVIIFAVTFIAGLSDVNALLFTGLLCVIAGAALHIIYIKKQSEY